jgi:hypothetical protein
MIMIPIIKIMIPKTAIKNRISIACGALGVYLAGQLNLKSEFKCYLSEIIYFNLRFLVYIDPDELQSEVHELSEPPSKIPRQNRNTALPDEDSTTTPN